MQYDKEQKALFTLTRYFERYQQIPVYFDLWTEGRTRKEIAREIGLQNERAVKASESYEKILCKLWRLWKVQLCGDRFILLFCQPV